MDDKLWWYIARSSGLTAWVLVSLTVLWGLVLSTRVLGNRAAPAWLLDLHRALGALTVVFVGVHLTGLVVDEYSAFGPSDILVPLASSFRPAAVAWGVVAMYLLVAIAVTSWTRRWIPDRLWRWVHASAHGVFVLATVHTLTAGTDAGGLFVKVFAVAVGTAYLFLATYRLLAGRRAPVLAGAPAAGSSPARAGSSTVGAAVGVAGAAFHPLTVREVRRETADSVSVSFEVPDQRAEDFRFEPGQFLSLRREVDGSPVTRQYSICSGLADGELRIAVRRADGGAVSPWIVDTLRAGDTLEVAPPAGRFTTALNALARRRVLGVAAGSGITPVLSILKSVLHLEPHSRAVLLVGNKGPDSVMLADAIDELAESADGRLTVVHQFSRPVEAPEGLGEVPVRHGRLDAERLAHPDFEPLRLGEVDDAFLCGPGEFVSGVKSHLIQSGVPADRIRSESFDRGAAPDLSVGAATEGTPLTIVAGGAASDVVQGGTDTILEAGLRAGLDLPYSCMAGSCGTCIARVTAGDVDPGAGELTADERAAGQVLTCQARATAPGTCVSYDPADATAVLTAVPGGTAAGRP